MIDGKKGKILFVDDEESILDIVSEYFQQKKYEVLTAKSGIEATKILQKEKIDCCFTDINMPEMNGLELAEHIKMNDNTIPVVIMTAYPSVDNTIRTIKNGVVDYLIKPVELNKIENCLNRVLQERQLFIKNILQKKKIEGKAHLERLNHELLYKGKELHILNKIMSDFMSITTSDDVFKHLVDMALEITRADESKFYIINGTLKKPFEVSASFARVKLSEFEEDKAIKSSIAIERLVMEIVSEATPLLISRNVGFRGLSRQIRSFIVIPLKIRENIFGALTASIKKADKAFTEKDLYYLSFMAQKAAYAIENLALYENIYENLFSTLYAFVKAIEAKDPYTHQHSNRVTAISISLGKAMHCSIEELDILNFAGRLHDIGKIGIRDEILQKPGTLTKKEFEIIKQHPAIGASIAGQLGLWDREQKIIKHHHERFDGSGYPDGLKKEEIPLLARILSVADAYDAMASDRAYRKRMASSKIVEIIKKEAGSQFDPEVVDAFQYIYKKGKISNSKT